MPTWLQYVLTYLAVGAMASGVIHFVNRHDGAWRSLYSIALGLVWLFVVLAWTPFYVLTMRAERRRQSERLPFAITKEKR